MHPHTAQANLEILAQHLKDFCVTRARASKFHRQMVHFETIEISDNRVIATSVAGFTPDPCPRPAAQMHGQTHASSPLNHRVGHIRRKSHLRPGIVIPGAHLVVDKQAQMRVIDLHDIDAGLAQQLQFTAQNRHAGLDECIAGRIGRPRLFRVPHPLAQQRRCRQCGLDLTRSDALEEFDFPRDKTRILRRQLARDNSPWPTVGRVASHLETMRQFGDHPDIRGAPPLAVGHHIEPRFLLQGHRVGHGRVHYLT